MAETWYKVDNVAKVFLASNTRRDPRVFRVSCTLTEPVNPELLNAALAKAARAVPQFQVTLHRGLFWHYFESTNKTPTAVPETLSPCSAIYGPDQKNELLYRVSYFGSRVNVEIFHALTDGNGGMMFLKMLIHNYLQLCHPAELAGVQQEQSASNADMQQDSFRKFYGDSHGAAKAAPSPAAPPDNADDAAAPKGRKKPKTFRLHNLRLPYDQHQYFEGHIPVKQMLEKSHELGVSLTSYMAAAMLIAVYQEMPALERRKEIAISLPVNLRNYYPSATARNFFNSVRVAYAFKTGEETFAEVAKAFDAQLKYELSPERVKSRMDGFEKLENMPAIKPVPLFIKNATVSFFNWRESKNVTLTLSNMGSVAIPEGLAPYIQNYAAYCSTPTLFTTVCSSGGTLVLGTVSAYRSTNVMKSFYRSLSAAGLDVTIFATEVFDQ